MMFKKQWMMMIAGAGLLALSACGKGDFNGTYTGYSTDTGTVTNGMNGGAQTMTLTLRQNDETVSGSVTATSTNTYPGATAANLTGNFTASAKNSGTLENVQLFMTSSNTGTTGGYYGGSMGGSFIYSGSLTAGEDGSTINGTLTSVQQQTGVGVAGSQSKVLNLTRQGE